MGPVLDSRKGAALLALGAAGAIGGALWWLFGSSSSPSSPSGKRAPTVYYRDRAKGVHPRLVAFLDWWASGFGPFPLALGNDGGVRADEATQARLYAEGRTKAKTLAETPHGRGCALDLYPVDVVDARVRLVLDEKDPRWVEFGELAESYGLKWGGRWTSIVDRPHVELPDWKQQSFPPRYA